MHPQLPLKKESVTSHSLRGLDFTTGSCFSAELKCDTKALRALLILAHFKSFLLALAPILTTIWVMAAGLQEEPDCRMCELVLVLYYLKACLCSRRSLASRFCDRPMIWEATSLWKAGFELSVILIWNEFSSFAEQCISPAELYWLVQELKSLTLKMWQKHQLHSIARGNLLAWLH